MPDFKDRIAYTHWTPTRCPVRKKKYIYIYIHTHTPCSLQTCSCQLWKINPLQLEYFSHGLCLQGTKDYPSPVFPLLLTLMEVKMTTILFSSVQFSRSVVSDSLRPHELQPTRSPCRSPPPRVTQTHVLQVGDAIQPSHPLSCPFPPAPNPSQHQSFPVSQLFA